MLLRQLSLTNFRNYTSLDLPLEPGLSLFWGDNGQGKSNLLEAAYLLATTRSFRTSTERDLVNWFTDTDPVFARVAGEVVRDDHVTRLDVILSETKDPSPPAAPTEPTPPTPGRPALASVRRRARVNGRDVPLLDLLGHLNAVLFSPEDTELISGPAERRRRYLDITLCQVDRHYLRNLRRYLRVLTQRNALLKLARERAVPPDEFDYWDGQLTQLGAELLVARLITIDFLNRQLLDVYPRLSHDVGRLAVEYRGTVPLEGLTISATPTAAERDAATAEVARRFVQQLAALQPRERALAVTLSGVHRDDAVFSVDGVDLRTYGSRGEQRLAALAVKLSETAYMESATGDRPVLLLDDVMSELDPPRRRFLQQEVAHRDQVLLTATDLAFFEPEFRQRAHRYHVASGQVIKGN